MGKTLSAIQDLKNQFRWKYRTVGSDWTEWKTSEIYGPGPQTISLWSGTHAGVVEFKVQVEPDESYSAVISWANAAHSLKSKYAFVMDFFASQVSLRVEYKGEVKNPDTYYLIVERV
jgi:hypothetical protein